MYYNENTIVYHNGEFVKAKDIQISPYNQSLHYGNGVFEGIRSYDTDCGAKIFKAEAHYKRLKHGAKVMSIPFNYSEKELIAISYKLLELNNLKDAYIRPLITMGEDMSLKSNTQSLFTMQCWEWGQYMGDQLLRVKTSKFQRPNPKSCFVEAKVTGHYTNSVLSTNEVKSLGYDEALLLDMNGYVAECSGANVFMEKDNKLYTPPKGNIMPGITRSTIIEMCKEENISVEEKLFTLEEFKEADSAFFTGTAAEVIGLKSIDEYVFPKDWKPSIGFQLMRLYKEEVLGKRHKKILAVK